MGSPVVGRGARTAAVSPAGLLAVAGRHVVGLAATIVTLSALWMAAWVTVIPAVGNWTPVAVTSGSMAPNVRVGDVILTASIADDERLLPGAVIVFDNPSGAGLVTHRIVALDASGHYVTKGDGNRSVDSTPVPPEAVRGVGRVRVPLVGMPKVWVGQGRWALLVATAIALAGCAWSSRRLFVAGMGPLVEVAAARPLPSTGDHAAVRPGLLGALATLVLVATVGSVATESTAAYTGSTSRADGAFMVDEGQDTEELDAGLGNGCLPSDEGHGWCSGSQRQGELGDDMTTDSPAPAQVL